MWYTLLRDISFLVARTEGLQKLSMVIRVGSVLVGTIELAKRYCSKRKMDSNTYIDDRDIIMR